MKRIALYAHFDADNEVKRYVSYCLEQLTDVCDRIDFVSTATLPEQELAKARRHCHRAITKDNIGYDFGMWKHALSEINVDDWDELLLVNSSMYGPLKPLRPIFAEMAERPCDFWGMNDSPEHVRHLQSYFLVFKREALHAPAFTDFWGSVLPYRTKSQIVRSYELGLSVYFADHNFRLGAYIPTESLFPRWPLDVTVARKGSNPTIFHADRQLERGMPFVKVELLRDNPGFRPLAPIYAFIDHVGYDRSLIELPTRAPKHGIVGAAVAKRVHHWRSKPKAMLARFNNEPRS